MKKLLLSLLIIASGSAVNAQSWTPQATGFSDASRGLSEIKIVDANIVWALAYDGVAGDNIQEFTRTTNGGTTWTPGVIDMGNPDLEINNITAVSATTAWVSALVPDDGNGVIYKTTDGGVTWVQQNAAAYTTSGSSFLNWVHFFDANNGIATGDPVGGEFEIWRTTDGGDNWTQVPAANIPNPLGGVGEFGLNGGNTAAGGAFWFVTDRGRLFKTTDMGVTWTASQAPLTNFGSATMSGNVIFSDANNGYLLKTVNTTTLTQYTTSNGGTTWSSSAPFTGTRKILNYIPGSTAIVATSSTTGSTGTSISLNNGTTWTDLEPGGTIQRGANAFLNGSVGWCSGFNTNSTNGGIFKLGSALGTTTFEATNKFKIFPNPANSNVTITAANVEAYKLAVTDLTGKVVLEKSLSGMENNLDISSLSSGAYFFTLNSDSGKETVKIIKN